MAGEDLRDHPCVRSKDLAVPAAEDLDFHEKFISRRNVLKKQTVEIIFTWTKYIKMRRSLFIIIFTFIITLAFTLSGQRHNLLQPTRPAKRFMPDNTKVEDIFNGDLRRLSNRVTHSHLAFVMYYAPWCSRSSKVKWEFERVSRIYYKEVSFIAVNCWHPNGHCRKKFNLSEYPQLYLYVGGSVRSIRYEGILTAVYFSQFISAVLSPLTPVHTEEQLVEFSAAQENTVVAFFNFNSSPQPPGFRAFYLSSIKILSQDPIHIIRFGVVSSPAMLSKFHISSTPSIFLLRSLNDTLFYPYENKTVNSDELASWVINYRQPESLRWIVPRKKKSLLLSNFVSRHPALILFLPINPVLGASHAMLLVREVALDYYNCYGEYDVPSLLVESSKKRWSSLLEHSTLVEQCRNRGSLPTPYSALPPAHPHCCHSMFNTSVLVLCDVCVMPRAVIAPTSCPGHMRDVSLPSLIILHTTMNHTENSSDSIMPTTNQQPVCEEQLHHLHQKVSVCCDLVAEPDDDEVVESKSGLLRYMNHAVIHDSNIPYLSRSWKLRSSDERVSTMADSILQRKCDKITLSKFAGYSVKQSLIRDFSSHSPSSFTGLACKTNRTLEFIAVDTSQYTVFAERLGFNDTKTNARIAIIDNSQESHYNLEFSYPLRKDIITEFITKFTRGRLDRDLRSSALQDPGSNSCISPRLCVVDVTTESFEDIVLDEKKDVLLFYHASSCGYCRSLYHIYYTTMYELREVRQLVFARVDGDSNDLPWHLTVEKYPAFIFFPAHNKASSAPYPHDTPVTVGNLVRFVLHHSSPRCRLQAALALCGRVCQERNQARLTTRTRELLHDTLYLKHRFLRIAARLSVLSGHDADVLQYRQLLSNYLTRLHQIIRRKQAQVALGGKLIELLEVGRGVMVNKDVGRGDGGGSGDGGDGDGGGGGGSVRYLRGEPVVQFLEKYKTYEDEVAAISRIDSVSVHEPPMEYQEADREEEWHRQEL